MKLMCRLLCLLLCLLLLGGSVLAADADSGLDTLLDQVRDVWDSLDLKDALDLSELTGAVQDLARESAQLDDADLEARIRELAAEHGLSLNDAQVEQLRQLVRSIEAGMETGGKLKRGFLAVRDWFRRTGQALHDFFRRAAELFQRLAGWLEQLF